MGLSMLDAYDAATARRRIRHPATSVLLPLLLAQWLGAAPPALADQPLRKPAAGAVNSPQRAEAPGVAAPIRPPHEPIEPTSVGSGQPAVRWKIPDQSDGRAIAQWLVRACPRADGEPRAPCQQIQALNGPDGRSSGTYVQARIPERVTYRGKESAVIAAEICSANRAGTSCADRVTLATGAGPAQTMPQHATGTAPAATPPPGNGIPPQPVGGFGSRRIAETGGQKSQPSEQALGVVAPRPGAPQLPQQAASASARPSATGSAARSPTPSTLTAAISAGPSAPILVSGVALKIAVSAPPLAQDIVVSAQPLQIKVADAVAPPDIAVSATPLRLSVTQGTAKPTARTALSLNALAVDAAPLRFNASAVAPGKPIVVQAQALALKASAAPPPASISVNAAQLKLSVSQRQRAGP